jgi:hypothetical protein
LSADEILNLLKLEPNATCGFVRQTFVSNQSIAANIPLWPPICAPSPHRFSPIRVARHIGSFLRQHGEGQAIRRGFHAA